MEIPSGRHTKNYGKSQSMCKTTNEMAIFQFAILVCHRVMIFGIEKPSISLKMVSGYFDRFFIGISCSDFMRKIRPKMWEKYANTMCFFCRGKSMKPGLPCFHDPKHWQTSVLVEKTLVTCYLLITNMDMIWIKYGYNMDIIRIYYEYNMDIIWI